MNSELDAYIDELIETNIIGNAIAGCKITTNMLVNLTKKPHSDSATWYGIFDAVSRNLSRKRSACIENIVQSFNDLSVSASKTEDPLLIGQVRQLKLFGANQAYKKHLKSLFLSLVAAPILKFDNCSDDYIEPNVSDCLHSIEVNEYTKSIFEDVFKTERENVHRKLNRRPLVECTKTSETTYASMRTRYTGERLYQGVLSLDVVQGNYIDMVRLFQSTKFPRVVAAAYYRIFSNVLRLVTLDRYDEMLVSAREYVKVESAKKQMEAYRDAAVNVPEPKEYLAVSDLVSYYALPTDQEFNEQIDELGARQIINDLTNNMSLGGLQETFSKLQSNMGGGELNIETLKTLVSTFGGGNLFK